jgi:NADH-quinone oxidoreductase subunit N
MKSFVVLLPEVFIALTLFGVVLGELGYRGERIRVSGLTVVFGLLGALIQTVLVFRFGIREAFGGTVRIDGVALFFKVAAIVISLYAILSGYLSKQIAPHRRTEYSALVLSATLGFSLLASAADLFLVWVSLFLVILSCSFLSGFGTGSARSTEAAVKLLVSSSVAGALLLFGVGILFSIAQSTQLDIVYDALVKSPLDYSLGASLWVLLTLGLAFYLAAFPSHTWFLDVLEGPPVPVSSFVALCTRGAGFLALTRIYSRVFISGGGLPEAVTEWTVLGVFSWPKALAAIVFFSLVLGPILALGQVSARRLVAALALSEVGALLLGTLVMDARGLAASFVAFLMSIFGLMGALFVLQIFVDEQGDDSLESIQKVFASHVIESIALVIFLCTLIGLPPTPGFVSKFALIGSAVSNEWYGLACAAVLSLAVSTLAVGKFVYKLMGFYAFVPVAAVAAPADSAEIRMSSSRRVVIFLFLAPILLISIFSNQTFQSLEAAAASLFVR